MGNFYTLLTNTGINAIIAARASNSEVKLTKIAVGDGDIIPSQDMTALKSEKHRFNINSIIQDIDNPNYLIVEGVIPSNVGGFYVSEVAIYTDQNTLFAIGSLPKTYKPLLEEGSAKDLTIKIFLEITNADSVTLKVDDSVVLATRKFVLSELKKYALINGDETKRFKVADAVELNEAINKKQFDDTAVKLTGNQTIAGVKTFSSNIVGNITGNSQTATKLTHARTITMSGDVSGSTSFDGSGNVTISAQVNDNSHNHTSLSGTVRFTGSTGDAYNTSNITVEGNGTADTVKATIGFHQPGLYAGTLSLLDANTFQFKSHNGSPATLVNHITGNAGTATKLQTARLINGVAFDGSANITVVDSTKAPLNSPALTGTPTAPTAAVATNNTQIATTAYVKSVVNASGTVGYTQSLSTNGWTKFPNGLIIQWGLDRGYDATYAQTSRTINFPIAFPNACFLVNGHTQASYSNKADMQYLAISSWSNTSFVRPWYIGRLAWIAIGY
ncbi:phage tail protein [Aliarcobacter butzleri]|uniref:phage tail protein n=1 Tax=Aliarcobacter butzleri TaxID=28197 RepID=UPI0012F7C8A2|nr:phage tail protein [Aliarcobacter butzleri]